MNYTRQQLKPTYEGYSAKRTFVNSLVEEICISCHVKIITQNIDRLCIHM